MHARVCHRRPSSGSRRRCRRSTRTRQRTADRPTESESAAAHTHTLCTHSHETCQFCAAHANTGTHTHAPAPAQSSTFCVGRGWAVCYCAAAPVQQRANRRACVRLSQRERDQNGNAACWRTRTRGCDQTFAHIYEQCASASLARR